MQMILFQLSYAGKGDNTLFISTGSRLTCKNIMTSWTADSHAPSKVIVDGAGSFLKMTGVGSHVGHANGHSVVVRNGAELYLNGGYWYFGVKKSDCRILLDAAKEAKFGAMYLTGSNNVIRLVNGSQASFSDRVYANDANWCYDCGFDIVDSTNTFTSVFVGNSAGKLGTTNFFIRLSGPAARANFTNESSDLYRSRLIFDLPSAGYPAGHVPLASTKQINMHGETSLEVENLAVLQADIRARGETSRTWRILTTTSSLNGVGQAVATANAKYAGGAVFLVTGGNIDVTVYGGLPSTFTVASAMGAPDPAVGVHTYHYGDTVTATVASSVYSGANNATRNGGFLSLNGWWKAGQGSFVSIEDSASRTNYLGSPYLYGSDARFHFRNANACMSVLYATAGVATSNNWIEVVDSNVSIDANGLIEVKDHVFYIRDAKSGAVTGFDPRRVRLGSGAAYTAVAEEGKIRLFRREADGCERRIQELDVAASCLAAEGDWLVAYVPARKAILRYKLTDIQLTNAPSRSALAAGPPRAGATPFAARLGPPHSRGAGQTIAHTEARRHGGGRMRGLRGGPCHTLFTDEPLLLKIKRLNRTNRTHRTNRTDKQPENTSSARCSDSCRHLLTARPVGPVDSPGVESLRDEPKLLATEWLGPWGDHGGLAARAPLRTVFHASNTASTAFC